VPDSSSPSESKLRDKLDPDRGRYNLEICHGGGWCMSNQGEGAYLASPAIVSLEVVSDVQADSRPQEICLVRCGVNKRKFGQKSK
jgi:hypothetical protein